MGVQQVFYSVTQAARVGWYLGQYLVAGRLSGPEPLPLPAGSAPPPDRGAILADLRTLLRRDWSNIAAGLYRLPPDLVRDPRRLLHDAARFFRDVPTVARRRRQGGGQEVSHDPGSRALPRYYRQNFHYQSGGYLSAESARLYDHQVEVLFAGGADAMRRQALVPIARHLAGRSGQGLRLLDVGSGTGRFLTFVLDNWPRMRCTALDLSAPYLARARTALAPWSRAAAVLAPAERLPFADASQDIVTAVFLLHELPAAVRVQTAAEMARVLKPGGLLVLLDSLQLGDRPDFDPLLHLFPAAFHEPYYADYVRADIAALFSGHGLRPQAPERAFLAKVMAFDKPAGRAEGA